MEAKNREPLAPTDPHILAIAADHAVTDTTLPVFDLDDTDAIADFVERVTGWRRLNEYQDCFRSYTPLCPAGHLPTRGEISRTVARMPPPTGWVYVL